MGTIRGPIGDALRMLEQEGLVITAPRRGTRVASLTPADAVEILAIREALEPVAVGFLLDRSDPAVTASEASLLANLSPPESETPRRA